MPIQNKALTEASPDERSAYARNFLNLDVPLGASDDAVLAAIQAAQPGATMIFVQTPDTVEQHAAAETAEVELRPEEQAGKMVAGLGRSDPRAVIHIPPVESQDGSGARDVVVGVNGRAWQLRRGFDLPVPWRVVEAIKNAQTDIVTHRMDEGHEGEVDVRTAGRIPFHFIEKPSDAAIAEWLERTGAEFCA